MRISGPDRSHYAARQLLASCDIQGADKTRLTENLAHYNSQLSRPIEHHWDLMDTTPRPASDERWLRKLRRDINKPYSDHEVATKAQELTADLKTLISAGGGFPRQMHLAGSPVKGRFGANSDLDLLGEGLLSDASCQSLAQTEGWSVTRMVSPEGQTVKQSVSSPQGLNADFVAPEYFEQLKGWYGETHQVDTSTPAAAEADWQASLDGGLAQKGLSVSEGSYGLAGQATSRPQEAELIPYPLNLEDGGFKILSYE